MLQTFYGANYMTPMMSRNLHGLACHMFFDCPSRSSLSSWREICASWAIVVGLLLIGSVVVNLLNPLVIRFALLLGVHVTAEAVVV